VVSGAGALSTGEVHACGEGRTAALCVFSVWRWRKAVHRGVVCMDGGDAGSGDACAEVAGGDCGGTEDRGPAKDHAAAEEGDSGEDDSAGGVTATLSPAPSWVRGPMPVYG